MARFSGSGLLSSGLIRILILKFNRRVAFFASAIFFFFLDLFPPVNRSRHPYILLCRYGRPGTRLG